MESRSEGIFEIVWWQRGGADRWIEITDLRSGRRRRVHSVEELRQFIRSCLPDAFTVPEPCERDLGGAEA